MIRADTDLAGRYRLESRIAVGGMGEVWRGTDLVLDRPVAIKLLHRADSDEFADAAARFRAEARHVGSLSHAGIAQVYDYGEADRGYPPFLVMELVDGPSLAGVLSDGPLDPVLTMDIVAQAAAALHEAHSAGLVHRDIKPGNLLLGPGDQVKIIDFGIAQTARSAEVTGTGAVIGSPAYLAPERVRGGAATAASDLYSLGIVTYECLAGAPPFSGPSMEVAHAHLHRQMPPLPPGVPTQITPFVEHLTAKDPAARPASAAEVARHALYLGDSLRVNRTLRIPVLDQGPVLHPGWVPFSSPGGRTGDDGVPGRPGRARAAARTALRDRPRSRLVIPLIVVAIAVLAGLVGWQVKGVLDAGQPAGRPAAQTSGHPAASTVTVTAATLDGQAVSTVRRQLRQLGLRPRLIYQPSDKQPGTVLSVSPSGSVQPGTAVVVTVAASPHGHDQGGGGGGGGD